MGKLQPTSLVDEAQNQTPCVNQPIFLKFNPRSSKLQTFFGFVGQRIRLQSQTLRGEWPQLFASVYDLVRDHVIHLFPKIKLSSLLAATQVF